MTRSTCLPLPPPISQPSMRTEMLDELLRVSFVNSNQLRLTYCARHASNGAHCAILRQVGALAPLAMPRWRITVPRCHRGVLTTLSLRLRPVSVMHGLRIESTLWPRGTASASVQNVIMRHNSHLRTWRTSRPCSCSGAYRPVKESDLLAPGSTANLRKYQRIRTGQAHFQ